METHSELTANRRDSRFRTDVMVSVPETPLSRSQSMLQAGDLAESANGKRSQQRRKEYRLAICTVVLLGAVLIVLSSFSSEGKSVNPAATQVSGADESHQYDTRGSKTESRRFDENCCPWLPHGCGCSCIAHCAAGSAGAGVTTYTCEAADGTSSSGCVSAYAPRWWPCRRGWKHVPRGRILGSGIINGKGGEEVSSHSACASLCKEEPGCNSYEYHTTNSHCDLNGRRWATSYYSNSKEAENHLFCQDDSEYYENLQQLETAQEEELASELQLFLQDPSKFLLDTYFSSGDDHGCDPLFEFVAGDIPGDGEVNGKGGGQQVSSTSECAGLCSSDDGCKSYEYKPSEKTCNLNAEADPTEPQWRDQVFCAKRVLSDSEQEQVEKSTPSPPPSHSDFGTLNGGCAVGFFPSPGDIPGDGEVNGKGGGQQVSSTSECAGLCSSDDGCKSYEYKPSEKTCNLNAEADPTEPQWRDQVFCVRLFVSFRP